MAEKAEIDVLITQVALGNQQSFSKLYDATSAKLYGVCLNILKSPEHAEDAVQDIYIKIWKRADQYQTNDLSPMTWLISIARNTSIDKLRTLGRHSNASGTIKNIENEAPTPEAELISSNNKTRIARCLELLESDKAEAVKSAYLLGHSYAELATKYDVPINTMRTWLRRSLLKLKGCLSND